MDLDFIRGIDADDEDGDAASVSSDDKWVAVKASGAAAGSGGRPGKAARPFSWDGLAAEAEEKAGFQQIGGRNSTAASTWSFRDAIARIDATSTRKEGSTLQEKVNRIMANSRAAESGTGRGASKAAPAGEEDDSSDDDAGEEPLMEIDDDSSADLAPSKPKKGGKAAAAAGKPPSAIAAAAVSDDDEASDEDDDDEEEDEEDGSAELHEDGEGESGNDDDEEVSDGPEDGEGSDDAGSDDDDDDDDEEEGEAGGASADSDSGDLPQQAVTSSSAAKQQQQPKAKGSSSAAPNAAAASSSSARRDTTDLVASALASARPNPLRSKPGVDDALPLLQRKAYDDFFEPDPFSSKALAKSAKGRPAKTAAAAAAAAAAPSSDSVRLIGKQREQQLVSSASAASAPAPPAAATAAAAAAALSEPTTFAEMNLSRPLLRAVAELGFTTPTPIQRRTIPLALAGHDLCGSAVTGSGKTAAYLLPVLERLLYKPSRVPAIRALVLTPTRELATQVHSMCTQLAKHCPGIRAVCVVGGVSLKAQEAELRGRPDIVIATPGRMLDHIRNTLAVHCDEVDVLVLDEADRLLEMGFEEEVMEVVNACPVGRQTMLYSATMTARVETLVKLSLRKPVRVTADPLYDMATRLSQEFVRIRPGREGDREALLLALLTRSLRGGGVLVFATQKHSAHRLAILLSLAGISAGELHGNLTQRQRLAALEDFREGKADVLIATDLAGRGLDITGVRAVVNFEMPRDMTSYVHRVGRTARAGRAGVAVTLVSESQRTMMREIVKRAALNVKSRTVPPESVSSWRDKIEGWTDAVAAVLAAEREERELRLAEMEATKAGNLMDHKDEIAARPARSWFQSEKQKAETKVASSSAGGKRKGGAEEEAGGGEEEGGEEGKKHKGHRLTRRKRRRMEAEQSQEKEARRIAKAEAVANSAARKALGGAGGSGAAGALGAGDAAPFIDQKLRRDKRRLEQLVSVSRSQHSLAKRAKAAMREATTRTGMSAGMTRKLGERQLKAKKKRSSELRKGRRGEGDDEEGDGGRPPPRSEHDGSGGGGGGGGAKPKKSGGGKGGFHSKSVFKRR